MQQVSVRFVIPQFLIYFNKALNSIAAMPYVDKDGVLVQKTPFTIYGLLWSVVDFCYLWFQSLINADFNKHGERYTRTYGKPGGGPPRPPSRKLGGFNNGSSPGPAPAGGCGCGG